MSAPRRSVPGLVHWREIDRPSHARLRTRANLLAQLFYMRLYVRRALLDAGRNWIGERSDSPGTVSE